MGSATALALVAALLIVSVIEFRRCAAVTVVIAVTVLVGAVMGLAMTVSNYHYLTDAVGGFCLAACMVLGLALMSDGFPPDEATSRP
jgi:undecaprenyl-diphosphatase